MFIYSICHNDDEKFKYLTLGNMGQHNFTSMSVFVFHSFPSRYFISVALLVTQTSSVVFFHSKTKLKQHNNYEKET